ncbi:carcinine transporter [Trichonephila clavata]|uniref:Carcinine transporter n=1 Tax=Trichonephila clavata TaxID=2740835 RepID=A0A8X6G258_TRICU|nr:carcinine transporter [Trichonephila clavata]
MDFEDILKDVGGFGVYQKVLVAVFLIPTFIVIPWFSMNSIFLNNSPEHWCNVPEVVNTNLSIEAQQYLIRPAEDPYCRMYDVDYSELLHSGNFSVNQSWPTKECDQGWSFDRTNYEATSVTRWNMVVTVRHFKVWFLSLIFIGDVLGTPLYGFLSDKIPSSVRAYEWYSNDFLDFGSVYFTCDSVFNQTLGTIKRCHISHCGQSFTLLENPSSQDLSAGHNLREDDEKQRKSC